MQKKRVDNAGGKRDPADFSDVNGEDSYAKVSSFGTKKGNGYSGVPFWYHTKSEYDIINKGNKDEIWEWRKGNFEGGKKKGSNCKFYTTEAIVYAVEKKVTESLKAIEHEKSNGDEAKAWIMSIIKKHAGKYGKIHISEATAEPNPNPTAPAMRIILKWANNAKACPKSHKMLQWQHLYKFRARNPGK